jgi:hypothetical protein
MPTSYSRGMWVVMIHWLRWLKDGRCGLTGCERGMVENILHSEDKGVEGRGLETSFVGVNNNVR